MADGDRIVRGHRPGTVSTDQPTADQLGRASLLGTSPIDKQALQNYCGKLGVLVAFSGPSCALYALGASRFWAFPSRSFQTGLVSVLCFD